MYPLKIIFRLAVACGIFSLLWGCASPTVVKPEQVGDHNLSCPQLVEAIAEAKNFEDNARHDRGATGTNVAAVLFFWPGLIATYANTSDAIEAAQQRQRYLDGIYNNKKCDQKMAAQSTETPAEAPAAPTNPNTENEYVVTAISGAPAFTAPDGKGDPLFVFSNGSKLTVIKATDDKKWYQVLIPDGRTGFVPAVVVRAPTSESTQKLSQHTPTQ